MCVDDANTPSCSRIGLILRGLGGETENFCVDGKNHGVGYSKRERVAMQQEFSLDFLTSTQRRGISSGPCCLICCAGRRVYGCKRLDSVNFSSYVWDS